MGWLTTAALPSGADLLRLEADRRRTGTGLSGDSLCGCWQLQQTWPKGSDHPAPVSSWLLRTLGAQLDISQPPPPAADLSIVNRVSLGLLTLRFVGAAQLQGRRPLLQFWFTRMELVLNSQVLWQRPLAKPTPKRLPFFALIQRDPAGWLAARGRGGGLALWLLVAGADAK